MIADFSSLVENGYDYLPVGGPFLKGALKPASAANGQAEESIPDLRTA